MNFSRPPFGRTEHAPPGRQGPVDSCGWDAARSTAKQRRPAGGTGTENRKLWSGGASMLLVRRARLQSCTKQNTNKNSRTTSYVRATARGKYAACPSRTAQVVHTEIQNILSRRLPASGLRRAAHWDLPCRSAAGLGPQSGPAQNGNMAKRASGNLARRAQACSTAASCLGRSGQRVVIMPSAWDGRAGQVPRPRRPHARRRLRESTSAARPLTQPSLAAPARGPTPAARIPRVRTAPRAPRCSGWRSPRR